MSDWSHVRLADICEINIGRTPSRDKPKYWGGNHPWASIADLNQGHIISKTSENITDVGANECNCRLVEKGTVILSFKLSIGKVAVSNIPLFTNEAIAALPIRNKRETDTDYLAWTLRSIDLKKGLDRAAKGLTLNKAKLKELSVPLPPLPEQRRIAAILNQADALRAKRRCASEHVGQLAQALFSDAFGDPSKNSKDWPTSPLASLIADGDSINYGVIQPGTEFEGGIPLVRVSDIHGGYVSHQDIKHISPEIEKPYKRSRLRGDEVLVSCVGSIGIVALARESEKGFNVARAIARIRVNNHVRREFISTYLQTHYVQDYFKRELRTSSQPTLNIKQIGETPVPVPPIQDQDNFVKFLNVASDLQAKTLRQGQLVESLFTSLQHRAFTGAL